MPTPPGASLDPIVSTRSFLLTSARGRVIAERHWCASRRVACLPPTPPLRQRARPRVAQGVHVLRAGSRRLRSSPRDPAPTEARVQACTAAGAAPTVHEPPPCASARQHDRRKFRSSALSASARMPSSFQRQRLRTARQTRHRLAARGHARHFTNCRCLRPRRHPEAGRKIDRVRLRRSGSSPPNRTEVITRANDARARELFQVWMYFEWLLAPRPSKARRRPPRRGLLIARGLLPCR